MKPIFSLYLILLFFESCGQSAAESTNDTSVNYNISGSTVKTRFLPPDRFKRTTAKASSFAEFLRSFALKAEGAPVKLYNGALKRNQDVHAAVLDIDVGTRDLQQCADAVMRLRAEYLYSNGQYDKIHFNFTNGFRADYSEWVKGKRIALNGNNTSWVSKNAPSNTYTDFKAYMETVFTYAGTLSLSKELVPVKLEDIKVGDVFIRGGSPGHAVIVMDVVENQTTGEKLFMLAQSYMPAQDIHILRNPNDADISPWYSTDFSGDLETPEWTFSKDELMRFREE
jgi:hypothetical protein